MKSFTNRVEKWVIFFTILAWAALLTNVHAQSIQVDKSKWSTKLGYAVGPIGSHGFMVGSVLAPFLNKELGLNISVENTGGAVHNAKLCNAGTAQFAMTYSGIALDGWEGKAKWANYKKLRGYRAFIVGMPAVVQFPTLKKTGLVTLDDMNGKVVSLNRLGSGSNLWGNRILEELGIKPKRIATVSPADSNNLLRDGGISAYLCMGTIPHNAIVELSSSHDVRVLTFTPEKRAKFLKKYPKRASPLDIPVGTYKGQEKPVLTVTEYEIWLANAELPDDMVYMAVKAIFEKREQLIKSLDKFKFVLAESVPNCPIPLHRGAYMYYKEKGITIPKDIMPVD